MNEPPPNPQRVQATAAITSPANPRVRAAARLRDASVRRETGLTLVDGVRELSRCVAAGVEVREVFVNAETGGQHGESTAARPNAVLAELAARGMLPTPLADRPFRRIAFGDRDEGLVAVVRFRGGPLERFQPPAGRPLFVIEGVEKPGNLGAILRSADAAGVGGVIVCGSGTDPAHPAVIRASLGTVFHLPLAVATTAETITWCQQHRRLVTAATPDGDCPWHRADLGNESLMLLGSEARGISTAWQEAAAAGRLAVTTIVLPMLGVADSLNVSAAAAVLAYESLRQRQPVG